MALVHLNICIKTPNISDAEWFYEPHQLGCILRLLVSQRVFTLPSQKGVPAVMFQRTADKKNTPEQVSCAASFPKDEAHLSYFSCFIKE